MNTDNLLACPFCKSAKFVSVTAVGSMLASMPARPYQVRCRHLDCEDVRGPVAYGRQAAIAAWNSKLDAPASKGVETLARHYHSVATDFGGCSDGGCVIQRPTGQHTNGGCRCVQHLTPTGEMGVRRLLMVAQNLVHTILKGSHHGST